MVTPPLAQWSPDGVAGKSLTVGPQGDMGFVYGDVVQTRPNGMPFPQGAALHQWLTNAGALTNDKLPIWYARHNADLTAMNTASQAWIQLDPTSSPLTKRRRTRAWPAASQATPTRRRPTCSRSSSDGGCCAIRARPTDTGRLRGWPSISWPMVSATPSFACRTRA